jgi:transcriptional regulator of acetoin/glycerol metabolism
MQWPGNVRELAHELERAIVFEGGAELNLEQLQTPIDPNKTSAHTGMVESEFSLSAGGFCAGRCDGGADWPGVEADRATMFRRRRGCWACRGIFCVTGSAEVRINRILRTGE